MADIIKCQECGIIVGQYVSLSEHENLMADFVVAQVQLFNLPAMNKLLAKIEMENQKLEAIIQRVVQLAYSNPTKEELAKLLADCEEVLK